LKRIFGGLGEALSGKGKAKVYYYTGSHNSNILFMFFRIKKPQVVTKPKRKKSQKTKNRQPKSPKKSPKRPKKSKRTKPPRKKPNKPPKTKVTSHRKLSKNQKVME